ncbi:hypothetical protein [Hymenobacter jeollabukensis]|uniref:T9SS type A sorting domain-containing protein n=1 Tax=Hymenobacter jeollabukensis TaxID=2025313 RepID=A0A5R8WI48_9BACT|nr:hypothetical protein [Hymenobacter jeollabukensis]TLM87883.1 hypothetical protein FDY95_24895 [Hymenobacter jeollabukensis]
MKLLLQTAALMTLLLIGTGRAATAQEPTAQPVCLDQVAECVYLVRVSNPAQLPGRLQLVRATDGAVLYEQASTAPAFGQKLNVGQLTDGRYAVVVQLGSATHRFALDLHTTQTRSARLISLATPAR